MNKIKANKVLFIKLGQGGEYEKECIEEKNILKLGYIEVDHELKTSLSIIDIVVRDYCRHLFSMFNFFA